MRWGDVRSNERINYRLYIKSKAEIEKIFIDMIPRSVLGTVIQSGLTEKNSGVYVFKSNLRDLGVRRFIILFFV